ncbi:MAG TPA: hypothetical protein VHW09_20475 [Bryobacteraceae bacterium]|jgi:hypothetical protein|nr:hypothetical protein [Bryobacteraceae bacterium]
MACAICQIRRPRRFCPGVSGDICSICCGTEREVSVDCPLSCEYLRAAHRHEKPPDITHESLPNRDLMVEKEDIDENSDLLRFVSQALGRAAAANPAIVDFDLREALEALVRTHRTAQSGLIYESLPANPLAAGVCQTVEDAIAEFRHREAEEVGVHKTRESAVLGVLVFLQHFEISFNNGRRRGRAFMAALLTFYSEPAAAETAEGGSSLILP